MTPTIIAYRKRHLEGKTFISPKPELNHVENYLYMLNGEVPGGKFLVIFAGGFIGLIIMRYAANFFVKLLHARPGLEIAAFLIVGWVGVKLLVYTLSHPALSVLPEGFAKSPEWKITFYAVLILIAIGGWFLSKKKNGTSVEE